MIVDFFKTFFLVFFIFMSFYITDVKGKSVKQIEDKNQTRSFKIVDDGFVASNKTDLCEPNPCNNNGSCHLLNTSSEEFYMNASSDGFICICAGGYSGRYCETVEVECQNLTCVNNGICIKLDKEQCICPLGFKGERCEIIDKDESTCIWYFKDCEETGGYCTSDENGFKCVCPNGTRYLSRHGCLASKDIRNCSQDMINCENTRGYCTTNRYQELICKCPGNYKYEYGYGCANVGDTVNCSLYYMRNCEETGGYCTREINGRIQCKCPKKSTYEPKYGCRKICYDGLCVNGGTCIVERGQFKCVCKENFVGKFCETDLCRGDLCKNGGICRVDKGEARCFCKEPYGGKYCDIRMDNCESNICQNGGICRTMNWKPECFCMQPYSGTNCEKLQDPLKMTVAFAILCTLGVIISSIVTSVICLCCHRTPKAKK